MDVGAKLFGGSEDSVARAGTAKLCFGGPRCVHSYDAIKSDGGGMVG